MGNFVPVSYFVENSHALEETMIAVPIIYKFSLLQAAAATVNSDESTSKPGRSKVKNTSKIPRLQFVAPENYHSVFCNKVQIYIVLFIRLFMIFSLSGG